MYKASLAFDYQNVVVLVVQHELFGSPADEVGHHAIDGIAVAFDNDPEILGILTALCIEIGSVIPPVGLNLFAVSGVTVLLSATSGILTIEDPVTNDNGIVTAKINAGGDPTNRPITITADANGVIATNTFQVVGTILQVSGAAALPQVLSATP